MKFQIKIYQIKKDEDLQRKFLFTKLDWLENGINDVNINNYEMVYENEFNYALPENRHEFMDNILEAIFNIFNISSPEDFKGHSLSISDIVEVDGTKYFVDDYGFVELKNNYMVGENECEY